MELLNFVLCSLFVGSVWCGSEFYMAAVVDADKGDLIRSNKYATLINEAAQSNVDLFVLPTPKAATSEYTNESCVNGLENFDKVVKSVSTAAKLAHMYVVAPLNEKVKCQDKEELITSNLVFDRAGALIYVHRRPVNSLTKCNTTSSRIGRFTTDFGVTFGVLVAEDLLLANAQEMEGIKNIVITDDSVSKKSFMFAKQFQSSWAFVKKVNVISASGFISGTDGLKRTSPLIVAKLGKSSGAQSSFIASPPSSFPSEDLSQYVIKPVNLEASLKGYSDSVCHGRFCCQFFVKTSVIGTNPQDVSYGLVAFDGIHQSGTSNIGVQTCSLVACAGLYKRSCFVGSERNTTNINFNKISINANFSKENTEFPTISTTTQTVFNEENFKFTIKSTDYKYVTTEIHNTDNILTFGIIGRDYSKDFESTNYNNTEGKILDFTEYISGENVQEFFDYVWIRLRVVIFIVSVYILEMM